MHYNVELITKLSVMMVITSVLAAESRNLRYSAISYAIQALLLCSLFAAFAAGSSTAGHPSSLWWWVVVALITKAILTPHFLWQYINRTGQTEGKAIIGFGPSVVIAGLLIAIFYKLTHSNVALLSPTPDTMLEPFRTNLAVAFTIFALGLYTILSRRDAIKMVVGLCLLENAVHLSLVSLAPGLRETALVGIATEVVVTIYLLLYIIGGIRERFGSTDTFQLSELHW